MMSFFWLTLLSAFRILRRNPLRAGLTMLGIIIGIGAVVAMVSLGQGATASVQAEISSLGTNVLVIVPGATTVGGVRGGLGSISTLTVDDAEDIEKKVASVTTAMYGTRSVLQVIRDNKNWSTVVFGTTPVFPDIRNWPITQGNFFTQSDLDSAAKVAVVGKTVVQNLFEPGEEVVGSEIRIRNVSLRVIGVLASKGQSITGQDQDDFVVLPFSTAERKVLGRNFWEPSGSFWWRPTPDTTSPPSRTISRICCEPDIGSTNPKKTTLPSAPWRTSPKRSPARVRP